MNNSYYIQDAMSDWSEEKSEHFYLCAKEFISDCINDKSLMLDLIATMAQGVIESGNGLSFFNHYNVSEVDALCFYYKHTGENEKFIEKEWDKYILSRLEDNVE